MRVHATLAAAVIAGLVCKATHLSRTPPAPPAAGPSSAEQPPTAAVRKDGLGPGRAGSPGRGRPTHARGSHGAPARLARGAARAPAAESYGRLPLSFEKNEGQTAPRVRYLARGSGYSLFLCSTEAVLSLRAGKPPATEPAVVRLRLVGGNPDPEVSGSEPLPGRSHYFVGRDPRRWRTDVPHYARVRYRQVYPGIDLVYYGNQRRLEYDFVIAPGRDPRSIRLSFEGADAVRLDEAGNLVLEVEGARLVQNAPVVYQEANGERRRVAGAYSVRGAGEFGFELGAYDASRPLVIDPVLVYSTYLGGNGEDAASGIAVDDSGSAYVTGRTFSSDFPMADPFPGGTLGVFVTKLSPDGGSLVYSTYLGGGFGRDIAVDSSGSAYVVGDTSTTDFPTVNAFQAGLAGVSDAFVTKLSPAGSALVYSTYLGGADYDDAWALTVDGSGSAYVVGQTRSADFPTQNPYQADAAGGMDAYVTKLSPTGSTLEYSTYLGGSADDTATAVAVDGSGSGYVAGWTVSTDFPTLNPYQTAAGSDDAFVTKLSPGGSSLVYSTYLGGGNVEIAYGMAVDAAGSAHVAGVTYSPDFPVLDPYQTVQSSIDAFVTKVAPTGSSLDYSTYLGGSGDEVALEVAVDATGGIYVAGYTSSEDFPVLEPVQGGRRGFFDGFVTKLAPGGGGKLAAKGSGGLEYSTYLGGAGDTAIVGELVTDMALHASGDVFVTGYTESTTFPTMDPYQAAPVAVPDAFVARIGPPPPLAFYTVAPCRAVDTRSFSGPALACSPSPTPRTFALAGACGIPEDARAVSFNLAVTQPGAAGNFRLFPSGSLTPLASSINYAAGATRGNNGVVRLSAGALGVSCHQASGTAHAIIDVNGYFK